MDRFQDNVDHHFRCGDDGRMVHGMRVHPSFHAIGHEPLRLLSDHPVLLGDEKPTRADLPERPLNGDADAGRGDRSLYGGEPRLFLTGCVLSKCRGERI